ncbi:MAG: Cys-Gln thioester bond-forming surface protein, partial [Crenarchaeota archaeon]|nr:Cys-Gln thioester bond-forming surface protein [Thermoproteota archaeon]
MKKTAVKFTSSIIILFLFISFISGGISADSIDYTDTYQWTGTGINGITYNNLPVMKFNMTDDYVAFCVELNVTIQKNKNYIKMSLEDAKNYSILSNTEKIRAILNYSWDKTNKNEITAIQHALWHYMNGHNLPNSANNTVKNIYNILLDDIQTPPIPASDENIINILNVTPPSPNYLEIVEGQTDYFFIFEATSSTGATLVFNLYNELNEI